MQFGLTERIRPGLHELFLKDFDLALKSFPSGNHVAGPLLTYAVTNSSQPISPFAIVGDFFLKYLRSHSVIPPKQSLQRVGL